MKKIFKTYCLVIISCFVVLSASARDGVAVVIDAVSYKKLARNSMTMCMRWKKAEL